MENNSKEFGPDFSLSDTSLKKEKQKEKMKKY